MILLLQKSRLRLLVGLTVQEWIMIFVHISSHCPAPGGWCRVLPGPPYSTNPKSALITIFHFFPARLEHNLLIIPLRHFRLIHHRLSRGVGGYCY